jgi:hypothetical protein
MASAVWESQTGNFESLMDGYFGTRIKTIKEVGHTMPSPVILNKVEYMTGISQTRSSTTP